MNRYDWKYIFKKVFIGVVLFVLLGFIKSCNVRAATFDVSGNTTIAGYNLPDWWDMYENGRTLLIRYEDWQYYSQMPETGYASYGYFYACATRKFTASNPNATCNDGCFNNEFQVVNVGGSCSAGGETGQYYFVFYSVKKWGWTNSDTLPYILDNVIFTGVGGRSRVYFLSNNLSDENYYINYAGTDRLQELQEQTNSLIQSQTTQQHNDSLAERDAINNQTTTQHNDSIAERNAINSNTDAINDLNDDITDDNVSGAESSVDSLLNNSAFTDSSGVNAIISLPLNFIQSLTSKSCRSLLINIPYMNEVVTIPCMQNYIHTNAPTIYLIIKTLVNGYVIYRVLLDILSMVKSARNPDDDRIEVLDL